jgi:hypothetical protein
VKVEMTVDWNDLPNEERPGPIPHKRYPKIPTSRADRRLYFIALARHIEEAVDSGQFDSLAAAARACRVSRARVSQLFV